MKPFYKTSFAKDMMDKPDPKGNPQIIMFKTFTICCFLYNVYGNFF